MSSGVSLVKSRRTLYFPSAYPRFLFCLFEISLLSSLLPFAVFIFILLLFPYLSSLPTYLLDEEKAEFPFLDQVHFSHLSLPASHTPTAAHTTAHPACLKGEHVYMPNCTTPYKNGEGVSFLPFPSPDFPLHICSAWLSMLFLLKLSTCSI